jgi:hypothetical protein
MARAYRMTSARRYAIKKAQAASARKRRGKRRRNIGIGIGAVAAGAGVVAVTMAASGYRTRGRKRELRGGNRGVVGATLGNNIKYSNSKEVDVFRETIEDVIQVSRRGKYKGLDYGRLGKPYPRVRTESWRRIMAKNKIASAGKVKKKKGIVRVKASGLKDRVLRDRQKFNADRRNSYSPNARRDSYEAQKALGAKGPKSLQPGYITPSRRKK